MEFSGHICTQLYSFFVFAIYQGARAEDRLENWPNKIDPASKSQLFTLEFSKSEDKLKDMIN